MECFACVLDGHSPPIAPKDGLCPLIPTNDCYQNGIGVALSPNQIPLMMKLSPRMVFSLGVSEFQITDMIIFTLQQHSLDQRPGIPSKGFFSPQNHQSHAVTGALSSRISVPSRLTSPAAPCQRDVQRNSPREGSHRKFTEVMTTKIPKSSSLSRVQWVIS
jgi:hypothetical protein